MPRIFVCYSRKDSRWVRTPEGAHEQALIPWLRLKMKQRGIEVWSDEALEELTGVAYDRVIEDVIDTSETAVLIISDDFFLSEYIAEKELPRIRARVESGEMQLFPIVVGAHIDWGQNADSVWLQGRQIHPSAITPLIRVVDSPADWSEIRSKLAVALRDQVLAFKPASVLAEERRREEERRAGEEAERIAREEAERRAAEEARRREEERVAREVAERIAREEAERRAAEEARLREEERRAQEEAERIAREEAERRAAEEARQCEEDRRAKEEAERVAREEAERCAAEEARRRKMLDNIAAIRAAIPEQAKQTDADRDHQRGRELELEADSDLMADAPPAPRSAEPAPPPLPPPPVVATGPSSSAPAPPAKVPLGRSPSAFRILIFIVGGFILVIASIVAIAQLAGSKRSGIHPGGDVASVPPPVPYPLASPGRFPSDRAELTLPGGLTMAFRWCPPGSFKMGSPTSEAGREEDEDTVAGEGGEQLNVTLSSGFWMAETEVTQAQWQAIHGTTLEQEEAKGPSYGDITGVGDDQPMYFVSWNEIMGAQASGNPVPQPGSFMGRLRERTGFAFTLPTEAQWEYACRAGATPPTPFHFGATITPEQVNYNGNYPYGGAAMGLDRQTTTSVRSFPANGWGLHDMHGNVWEWCVDWYGTAYAGYPAGGVTNPIGPTTGSGRVVRGGSWLYDARLCRSANRSIYDPSNRFSNLGFRPVLPVQ